MNFIYVKCHIQVIYNLIKLFRNLLNCNFKFHFIVTMLGSNQPNSNKIDCFTINTTKTYVWKKSWIKENHAFNLSNNKVNCRVQPKINSSLMFDCITWLIKHCRCKNFDILPIPRGRNSHHISHYNLVIKFMWVHKWYISHVNNLVRCKLKVIPKLILPFWTYFFFNLSPCLCLNFIFVIISHFISFSKIF
jgi:hypothetical protein